MAGTARVSVVIVTYESRAHILTCLDALLSTAKDIIFDCTVVDNASGDGGVDAVSQAGPWVHVIRNGENLGFGKAVNIGVRAAVGDYVLIMNPDTVVQPGALHEMASFLDHRPQAAACGPQLLSAAGEFQRSSRRGFPTPLNAFAYFSGLDRLFPRWHALNGYQRRDLPAELETRTDCISGACMLVRRQQFLDVGGFDEEYFLFGEDIDLCWKLKEAGWEIWYVPSAIVRHEKGASMRFASRRAHHEFYRAMNVFMDKRLSGRYPRCLLAAARLGVRAFAVTTRRYGDGDRD
jgi:GT2 family glycosyltransferase